MKIRYKQGRRGLVAVAKVYDSKEHGIDHTRIDRDAVKTVQRLRDNGFEAYIVGGAVRDLLLGKTPKDFDIATSASPRQVHRLFRNSRLIGRRFRLVHVVYGDKIFEVSTFRGDSKSADGDGNIFGTIEEDAKRRDFSVNAFYYDPIERTVLDFNNGMEDMKKKRLTSLIPLNRTFQEDPVRMIRAVKYSQTTGFAFRHGIAHAIRRDAVFLSSVSPSRLTEETGKILASGCSSGIIRQLHKLGLLGFILPAMSQYAGFESLYESLSEMDVQAAEARSKGMPFGKGEMFYALTSPFIVINDTINNCNEMRNDILRQVKVMISPNTPSNADVEDAVLKYMKAHGLKTPRKRMYYHADQMPPKPVTTPRPKA